MFTMHLGIPEMKALWDDLKAKHQAGISSKDEEKLYRKLGKAMRLISDNPRHPGLHSHEITSLSARYGMKVWESYLENNTPGAGRVFWVYGPEKGGITLIGLDPHPDDKSNAYNKITLSQTGKEIQEGNKKLTKP